MGTFEQQTDRDNRVKMQENLFVKLEKLIKPGFTDLSLVDLKNMVANKKNKASERLSKKELLLIQEYLSDSGRLSANEFPSKWEREYPFQRFQVLTPQAIEELLALFKKQETTSSSLIPIKGISKVMQTKLRNIAIYDIPGLLQKGKDQKKRNGLASTLDIEVKLVNSWVKQADLWRVDGMTPDTAFLLVQIGVRNVEDLAKIDVDKAYPIMERLCLTQPDFFLMNQNFIESLVEKAKELTDNTLRSLSLRMETNEPEPKFLFRADVNQNYSKSSGKIIREGLGFLDDVIPALPLPHTIKGQIYMKKSGEKETDRRPFPDALVEIIGISSPSADKTESGNNPSGYTDSDGVFILVMPDKYNLQEVITITVSQGANKQKFIKSASDIINAVKEQEILDCFDRLDAIDEILKTEKSKLEHLDWLKDCLKKSTLRVEQEQIKAEIAEWEALLPEIKAEISLQEKEFDRVKDQIKSFNFDKTTNSLERLLNNLVNNTNLQADLKDFTLTEEIFKGLRTDLKKALPSVKLMGNDDEPIHLSTDTAPSCVFSYGMLQRLVEPAVTPYATNKKAREVLTSPVDVMDFKEKLYKTPKQIPKMASLGIGYLLNMHQAWVPDGFALGSLLYSLVLAPGEEQRLIVREKSQSYTVSDDAEAVDATNESYALSQEDDTSATYNYAVNQLSKANSYSDYSAKTSSRGGSAGGLLGGLTAMFGLSGSYSKSSGNASSSASQYNSHNEASSTAQGFQHSIKSASEKVSQAKRISMRAATSEESDSVATKIVANHNHSHTLTIQYWEVMRRFRLETCIDGVELVLFVPLELISFLPTQAPYILSNTDVAALNKTTFEVRYGKLLQYADTLSPSLPYKYRSGLNLIKQYAAYPVWKTEEPGTDIQQLTLNFKCNFLSFDDVSLTLVLKNGKGTIAGNLTYDRKDLPKTIQSTRELKQTITEERNTKGTLIYSCTFDLPADVVADDFSYIRINHSCESFDYMLFQNYDSLSNAEKEAYGNLQHKLWNLAEDDKSSGKDRQRIAHYRSQLPEAFYSPNVTLSSRMLRSLGSPLVSDIKLTMGGTTLSAMPSSNTLNPTIRVNVKNNCKVLRYSELQEMESTLHHILSDTLLYSQVIWASLSEDERAMMLERYTIDMDFDKMTGVDSNLKTNQNNSSEENDIPLLNCVNVKKLLGFYGNCILLPFTYPQSLAKKLDKTAAEVQDALFRYHTNCFRVPSTTISLPTDGMIGEAVLGETNVSELIDITRFWNWKDSPIDKMEIDNNYLNSTDYLTDKATADISALDIQGASAPTAVTVPDLIAALVGKQAPQFNDITGLDQLKEILNEGTKSAASGRDKVLDNTKELTTKAMDYASKVVGAITGTGALTGDDPKNSGTSDKEDGKKEGGKKEDGKKEGEKEKDANAETTEEEKKKGK
ncbi:DUF4332 domain-containing protein [Bacteroidales bacterium OttesenSCG-928-A17]|nr:DUF4332 domain-containing protein [Bacteroidales bacterium OttesenSCG-928-A17]